jgi:RES domain-containing protein
MRVWRLAPFLFPPLDGEGARLKGGRWNSPGIPMVYVSVHLSLAVLETLVHVDPADLPDNLIAYEIDMPDGVVAALDLATLPPRWRTDLRITRAAGDAWARDRRSFALTVPSVVLPAERNVLLNPLHPDAAQARIVSETPFTFD